jgi:excisionase family DNA binding protein
MDDNKIKRGLHPVDVQRKFGISRSTVYRLCKLPGFPAYKIGKRVVIDPDELEAWLKEGGKIGDK